MVKIFCGEKEIIGMESFEMTLGNFTEEELRSMGLSEERIKRTLAKTKDNKKINGISTDRNL